MYDLVIIGAGPAGLSAAIHATRFGLNFMVLEKGVPGGQARAANLIENYPGFVGSGGELMDRFIAQAKGVKVEIKKNEVKKVVRLEDGYEVITLDEKMRSRAIILATGLGAIPVPEVIANGHKNILYYPIPSDVPHDGKNILIIGGGDCAFDEAISFSKLARSVVVVMRSDKPCALPRLIKRAQGGGVVVKGGLTDEDIAGMSADVVVACIGKIPLNPPLRLRSGHALVKEGEEGFLFQLAGDILHPKVRHIAAAVGDGVMAVERAQGPRPT